MHNLEPVKLLLQNKMYHSYFMNTSAMCSAALPHHRVSNGALTHHIMKHVYTVNLCNLKDSSCDKHGSFFLLCCTSENEAENALN